MLTEHTRRGNFFRSSICTKQGHLGCGFQSMSACWLQMLSFQIVYNQKVMTSLVSRISLASTINHVPTRWILLMKEDVTWLLSYLYLQDRSHNQHKESAPYVWNREDVNKNTLAPQLILNNIYSVQPEMMQRKSTGRVLFLYMLATSFFPGCNCCRKQLWGLIYTTSTYLFLKFYLPPILPPMTLSCLVAKAPG